MERIALGSLEHTVERVWVTGEPGHRLHARIVVGRLADGRPFVARSGNRWDGAWAGRDDRQVCDAADSWIRRRGGRAAWRELAGRAVSASGH